MTTARLLKNEIKELFSLYSTSLSRGMEETLNANQLYAFLYSLGWSDITPEICVLLVSKKFKFTLTTLNDEFQDNAKKGITYSQLVELLKDIEIPLNSPAECYEAFRLFNMYFDPKDKVTELDFRVASRRIGKVRMEATKKIFKKGDLDKDGMLNFKEFSELCALNGAGTETGYVEHPTLVRQVQPERFQRVDAVTHKMNSKKIVKEGGTDQEDEVVENEEQEHTEIEDEDDDVVALDFAHPITPTIQAHIQRVLEFEEKIQETSEVEYAQVTEEEGQGDEEKMMEDFDEQNDGGDEDQLDEFSSDKKDGDDLEGVDEDSDHGGIVKQNEEKLDSDELDYLLERNDDVHHDGTNDSSFQNEEVEEEIRREVLNFGAAKIKANVTHDVILEDDIRQALVADCGYSDFSGDETWQMVWEDFIESNKEEFLVKNEADGSIIGVTIEGCNKLMVGLGEM